MMISAARVGGTRDAHGDTNDEPLQKDDDEGHTFRGPIGPTSAERGNKIERVKTCLCPSAGYSHPAISRHGPPPPKPSGMRTRAEGHGMHVCADKARERGHSQVP